MDAVPVYALFGGARESRRMGPAGPGGPDPGGLAAGFETAVWTRG
jgi:hypothetical protein